MITNLFFNLSFDLGGISLILFVIWFFVNFNNAAAAFKWFSLSILALLASVIILSYGATKLSKAKNSLPTQNQTEIVDLKRKISNLKSKRNDHHEPNESINNSKSATRSHHKKRGASLPKVPSRIVNSADNQIVKEVVSKHAHHINLVAKVTNAADPIMVRGVHSSQPYEIHGDHNQVTVGEFVVVKGKATDIKDNTVNVKATSIKKQPNS